MTEAEAEREERHVSMDVEALEDLSDEFFDVEPTLEGE